MQMNKKILALLGAGHAVTDISQGVFPIIGLLLAFLLPSREELARRSIA